MQIVIKVLINVHLLVDELCEYHKYTFVFLFSTFHSYQNLIKIEFSRNTGWFKYDRDCLHLFTHKSVPVIFEPPCIFEKYSNIILHENPCSGIRVRTDGRAENKTYDEANSPPFRKVRTRLKTKQLAWGYRILVKCRVPKHASDISHN